MLAWAGVDGLRLEVARVVLGERSLRASGSLVSTRQDGTEAYCASYSLATSEMARAASCKASDGVSSRLACRHPSKQRRATVMASVLPLLQARGHGAVRVVALGYTLPLVIISTMQK